MATGKLGCYDLSLHLSACDLMIQPYPDGITTRGQYDGCDTLQDSFDLRHTERRGFRAAHGLDEHPVPPDFSQAPISPARFLSGVADRPAK
jgi:hypothetical protein